MGKEQLLWDAAELTQQQSWDWDAYYDQAGVARTGALKGQKIAACKPRTISFWIFFS